MPIYSKKNQYRGVNAHLNSFLQNQEGMWESFHTAYIVSMTFALDAVLPAGYFTLAEKSLQIREAALQLPRRPKPDVTIFAKPPVSSPVMLAEATVPTMTTPVVETLDFDEEDYLRAAVIYTAHEGTLGKPVARIELLSPTNKLPAKGYWAYHDKRSLALESGLLIIEIDYLHQTPPIIRVLPSYPDRQPNAQPYSIAVSDPRPTLQDGLTKIYSFGVDEAFPTFEIPLLDQDKLTFNLTRVYNETFERVRLYSSVVDYEQLPLNFESYTEADQAKIRQRMSAIQAAVAQGVDLDREAVIP